MKTIKDAVIELEGKLPAICREDAFIDGDEVVLFCLKHHKEDGVCWNAGAYCLGGLEFDRTVFELVCTAAEFEACAKRMGYINGYRWGVEYPTNGKRPELADDVLISVKNTYNKSEWLHERAVINTIWGEDNEIMVTAFRITDTRYKPADTSYLNALTQDQSLTHSEEGLTHSDWRERGELPPVGSDDFEWSLNGKCWEHGLMLFNDGTTCLIANKKYPANRHHLKSLDPDLRFRPIRTEREKVIEAAVKIYDDKKCFSAESFASELYKAGMLVLPPKKSDTED